MLNGSPFQICAQVPEITKPLASVDEMASNGMMAIMHCTSGGAKHMDIQANRRSKGVTNEQGGHEVVRERTEGAFTFEVDAKSEGEGEQQITKKAAKANSHSMDVDETDA